MTDVSHKLGVTAGETAPEFEASPHEKRRPGASGEQAGTDPETSSSTGRRMGGVSRNRGVTARRDGNQFNLRARVAAASPGADNALTTTWPARGEGKPAPQLSRAETTIHPSSFSHPLVLGPELNACARVAAARGQIQSSGDGLGIQQPGSNGQGRARDRAICPAVTRSSSRGGVETLLKADSKPCAFERLPPSGLRQMKPEVAPGPRETLSNLIAYPFRGGE